MGRVGEIFKASDGWRFRIKAGNGEVIAQSEAYENRQDAEDTMESLLLGEDEDGGADAGNDRP